MCLFSMFHALLNTVCSFRLHPHTGEQEAGKEKWEGGREGRNKRWSSEYIAVNILLRT